MLTVPSRMAHSDEPITSESPAAPPVSPSDAAAAAALKAITTPRADSLQSLIAAFTVYDTAFQQRQNDTLVAHAASHCHSLCRTQRPAEAGWGCLQGCSVQMLQVMSLVQERFIEQQQQQAAVAGADEEDDDDEQDDAADEDDAEVELVVVVEETGEDGSEAHEVDVAEDGEEDMVAVEPGGPNAANGAPMNDNTAADSTSASQRTDQYDT